jgi:hypothetical protein
MSIDETIKGRDASYGPFAKQAGMAQTLKAIMRTARGWDNLDSDMKEALDMIAAKMSRILIGDPKVADSWHDIAGYARLVELRLAPRVNSTNGQVNQQSTQSHPEGGLRPAGEALSGGRQESCQGRSVEGFGQWLR